MDETEDADLVAIGINMRNGSMVAIVPVCCDEAVRRVRLVT